VGPARVSSPQEYTDICIFTEAFLRWSRFLKNAHAEAMSNNLIQRWGRGNVTQCLHTWRAETHARKANASWTPSDILMRSHKHKSKRPKYGSDVDPSGQKDDSSSGEDEIADGTVALDDENESLTQIHSRVTSLQAWSLHVDRLARMVAEMSNFLLLEKYESESKEIRREKGAKLLQAVVRGRRIYAQHTRWLAAVKQMTFLLTPVVRKKILVRRLRQRKALGRHTAAKKIQSIAKGAIVRKQLMPWMEEKRQQQQAELLDPDAAKVGQRVLILASALYQLSKTRQGKVRISRPEFRVATIIKIHSQMSLAGGAGEREVKRAVTCVVMLEHALMSCAIRSHKVLPPLPPPPPTPRACCRAPAVARLLLVSAAYAWAGIGLWLWRVSFKCRVLCAPPGKCPAAAARVLPLPAVIAS